MHVIFSVWSDSIGGPKSQIFFDLRRAEANLWTVIPSKLIVPIKGFEAHAAIFTLIIIINGIILVSIY